MINTEIKDVARQFKTVSVKAEVIVIGAGIAGITAALTAARQGNQTVLITDRPILGGSASSEIRVGPCGAAAPPFNRFSRETGIIEEIFNHLHYMAQNAGKWRWFYFDQIYFDMVLSQENLSLYLNTSIFEAHKENNSINSVTGLQLRSETIYEFTGKMFIDCTGDGSVGFLSGAHFRIGRESRDEYNEVYSPQIADTRTMGTTLLFTTIDAGHPVKFIAPDWAVDIEGLPSLERINRSIHRMPDGSYYGFWWVEYGGMVDSIHDDGEIMLHLRKVVNGLWSYIKNSGKYDEVENQEINWIGYLPGKRESRRLIGPYIVTAHDMTEQRKFNDAIGYTGWPIDIHPPEGYLTNEPGCTHDYLPGITDIPFGCIFSKNISNLLFAGRHISSSHEALGTLRVISTTSVMAQAAAMAASMCLAKDVYPAVIQKEHMNELQEKLLRSDQSIIGKKLIEKNDFSRKAKVTVSSEKTACLTEPEDFRMLTNSMGLILPVEDNIVSLSLLMEADTKKKVIVDVYLTEGVPQNYRIKEFHSSHTFSVSDVQWYKLNLNIEECPGNKLFIMVRRNPDVKLYMENEKLTGVLGIETEEDILEYGTLYRTLEYAEYISVTPCFITEPEQRLFRSEMINNGHIRPHGLPNSWISEPIRQNESEWIKLSFEDEKLISSAEIVFNSDLNPRRIVADIDHINREMVKSYKLIAITSEGEKVLVSNNENHMRLVTYSFAPVKAKAIILEIYETWGSRFAEVFDLRVY